MRVLGIETSCDETAASVLEDGRILSNVVLSQEVHARFGGVVPEVASRAHMRAITPITREALRQGGVNLEAIDCISVTLGPGLIGSLIVGVSFAKALALSARKALIGVDHIEAHLGATTLAFGVDLGDFVSLLVSGGHTYIVVVRADGNNEILGSTLDDAAGEAFDKVAKLLGLGYPGGPEIEKEARKGDPQAVDFPRPVMERGFSFSFSGLKTAVRYYIERYQGEISPVMRADIAASFQEAVVDVLVEKTLAAAKATSTSTISVVGGVACNSRLRERLMVAGEAQGLRVLIPPAELCTDNAAIVAWVGYRYFVRGKVSETTVSPYSTKRLHPRLIA